MELQDALNLIQKQGCVIVATIDENGYPHTSCKGVIAIKDGELYLLDVYKARTFHNLQNNSRMSITFVDEHKYKGCCLKGKANIVDLDDIDPEIMHLWKDKISSRITSRIIKNVQGEKGHPDHPEATLPEPKYMIVMHVEKTVDLAPHHANPNIT